MYKVNELLAYNGKVVGIRILDLGNTGAYDLKEVYTLNQNYDLAIDKIPTEFAKCLNYRNFRVTSLYEEGNVLLTLTELDKEIVLKDVSNDNEFIRTIFENLDEGDYLPSNIKALPAKQGLLSSITLKGYGAMGLGYKMSKTITGNIGYEVVNNKLAKLTIKEETEEYPKGKVLYVGIKNIAESKV